MPKRTLVNGATVSEVRKAHKWEFESKCPAKWLHIDCESGQCYTRDASNSGWRDPSNDLLEIGKLICNFELMHRGLLKKKKLDADG